MTKNAEGGLEPKGAPQFVFALVDQDNDPRPTEIKVRRLLKQLGRQYGLVVKWPEPSPRGQHAPSGK